MDTHHATKRVKPSFWLNELNGVTHNPQLLFISISLPYRKYLPGIFSVLKNLVEI